MMCGAGKRPWMQRKKEQDFQDEDQGEDYGRSGIGSVDRQKRQDNCREHNGH